jgi:hypothetical protein
LAETRTTSTGDDCGHGIQKADTEQWWLFTNYGTADEMFSRARNMPLRKQRPLPRKGGDDDEDDGENGFSQERLDRIFNSMQPTMTRYASDEEMERLFWDVERCVGGVSSSRCLRRVGVGRK